jgi:simple sugar transport system ATP-binding protein
MEREFSTENVVEMKGIVKRFPGVLANDQVDFSLRKGEIHALLGENGAGKSTLMNILAGMYRQEEGKIKFHGKPVDFHSPKDAINTGIGMVHQHFMLVPSQSVTENILLGLDKPRFRLNLNHYDQEIARMSEQFGLQVSPSAKIWQLTVGEQQRVEILKMLYRGAEVLIMDEPTAVLAPSEVDDLFITLRKMTADGKSIIFISHKLQEVMQISDRVTVLQKGKVTSVGIEVKNTSREELARLMVGRDVLFKVEKKSSNPGEVVLDVQHVVADNDKGYRSLCDISLNVRKGEIVGLAGVAGNGQAELAEVITGLRKVVSGKVIVNEEDLTNQSVLKGIKQGISHVPSDRTSVGTAPNLSVTDNIIMKNYRHAPIGKGIMINMAAATKYAGQLKDVYEIVVPTLETSVRLLSGGNLQRVILAREISSEPQLMVAVQPTRGLDVGAIEGVHRLLLAQRDAGAAILLISEELEELFSIADRLYVIYEGELMGEQSEFDLERIGLMMTGTKAENIGVQGEIQHG